ncbi:g-protein alpha subunit, partial [Ostertagia ostertagi]
MAEEETQFACFTHDVCEAIQRVWHDTAVQKIYERRSEINLNDSSKYFLENLASINTLDFTPTPRDLIMSYVPTVGVQNVIFSVDNHVFHAIFFCIAISEYDQMMDEDPEMNRLQDALALLEKINKEPKFQKTPFLLFLNEVDVFREKLPLMPLQDHWPDYK